MALFGRSKARDASPEGVGLAPWFVAKANEHNATQLVESAASLGLADVAGSLAVIPESGGLAFRVSLEFVDQEGCVVTADDWDSRFIDGIRMTVGYADAEDVLVASLTRDGEAAVMTQEMSTADLITDRPAAEAIAAIPEILRGLPLSADHHAALESLPEPRELTVNGTDIRAVPTGGLGPRAPGP